MSGLQDEVEEKMKERSYTIVLHPQKQINGTEFKVTCKASSITKKHEGWGWSLQLLQYCTDSVISEQRSDWCQQ